MAHRLTSALALLCIRLCAQTEVPKQNPFTSTQDLERGARLFAANCAPCHGPRGNGGRGANLARPKLPRATDDRALFLIIQDGISGTEMPGAWSMTDHEIWQVAAHVRTLGRVAAEPVRGNGASGRELFRASGCGNCHRIGSEGGRLGPPLTDIGERRGAAYLRSAILDPGSSLPEDFTMIDVTTRAGAHISGIVLNEDTYSVQFRDLSDNLRSFWKQDLAAVERHDDRTPMPGFQGRLTDKEVDDLVAYLVSLRGEE